MTWNAGNSSPPKPHRLTTPRQERYLGTLYKFSKDLRMLLGNSQQGLRRPTWFAPTLFPILHGTHTHTHQARKGRLRQVELTTYHLRRRWLR